MDWTGWWRWERAVYATRVVPPPLDIGAYLVTAEYEGVSCLYCDDSRLRMPRLPSKQPRWWCPTCAGSAAA